MSLSLVTALTDEPVTLEEIKAHLRLDIDDDDALVSGYISAAREYIEGATKYQMMPQTWDEVFDYAWPMRYGGHRIDLGMNPVASVTSITYVDDAGASQTLDSANYTVLGRKHHSYIVPAYGVSWPSVRWVPAAVTVRYVAGDADEIPKQLTQALMLLVAHWYELREPVVVGAPVNSVPGDVPGSIEALISTVRDGITW